MNQSWRQSKQKSLNCPWLPPLFRLWPLVNYLVYFTTSSLRNHYEWERVLDHVWEDGLCKIHSIKCKMFKNWVWQLKCSKNCVSELEMPQMPNILFYQTFYKICCLQHICGNIFVASALKAPSKMLGTSGARSCSSPSQGPLAPPSLGVWVERPLM